MGKKGTRNPLIIPVFIPNQGCPHRCIFCQQEKITNQSGDIFDRNSILETIETAIKSDNFNNSNDRQIAFYGGTFTNLPVKRIKALLGIVNPYIKKQIFNSIRISTRPDAIDNEKLELIKEYGVSIVELGSQSMDDSVLALTNRGHTTLDTTESVKKLKKYGFSVGIQLMPGLPGDTKEKFLKGIDRVISLKPDMVRLYPTLVIKGTELEKWYNDGKYNPFSMDDAIELCVKSCERLEKNNIRVIRVGLMSSPSLLEKGMIVAGPWHESFGSIVRSKIFLNSITPQLLEIGHAKEIELRVAHRDVPLLRGYKNQGIDIIKKTTGIKIAEVIPEKTFKPGQIEINIIE